jgi:hypothetical protein
MRNKVLILFFLCWTMQSLLFAQSDSAKVNPKTMIETMLADKQEDRVAQMEKLFKTVSSDTTNKKVVSFNAGFREKYLDDQDFNYNQEAGNKTFLARLLEKIGRLLKRLFGIGSIKKVSDITLLVFKILCGLIVLVVIYFIIRLFMNHKGKWFFQKKNESIPLDINNTEQLIQSADFEQLIAEIERQGNTRQSIRLYYLWLLKDLKEKELIVWLPEKTNADYLAELREEALRKQFSYLSYLFNYIWYGEFSITDEDYISAKKAFLIYLRKGNQHG